MDGYDEQPAGLCFFLCGAAECLSYTEGEALAGCGKLWQPVGAFFYGGRTCDRRVGAGSGRMRGVGRFGKKESKK